MEVSDAEREKQVEGLLHVRHDVHPVDEAHRLLGLIFEKLTRANNAAGEIHETFEGAQIAWVKDTTTEIITLTITADDGTVTTMAVPIGDFKF